MEIFELKVEAKLDENWTNMISIIRPPIPPKNHYTCNKQQYTSKAHLHAKNMSPLKCYKTKRLFLKRSALLISCISQK